jgi:hypothetical protein
LKDLTMQPTGLKAFTTCLITPSLPEVSKCLVEQLRVIFHFSI